MSLPVNIAYAGILHLFITFNVQGQQYGLIDVI
jgi:hypothetical protein